MEKFIIITFILCSKFSSFAQHIDCTETKLYDLVFKEQKLYEKKVSKVDIGYIPSKFVFNSLKDLNILEEEELKKFWNFSNIKDYEGCSKFQRKLKLITDDSLKNRGKNYVVRNFSNVIELSKNKKCILVFNALKNRSAKGGKAFGSETIYILEKSNENWHITNKKSIVLY